MNGEGVGAAWLRRRWLVPGARRLVGVTCAVVVLVAGACSDDDPSATPEREPDPTVETTPEATVEGVPESQLVERECDVHASLPPADCYWLEVPENRRDPDTRMIRLWVAMVHPGDPEHPDAALPPVIDLQGGPGDTWSTPWVDGTIQLEEDDSRRLLVLDQRGTGRSQPRLACPEMDEGLPPADAEARAEATRRYTQACKERLESEGVDLAGYDTIENAADVVDLRRLLNEEQLMVRGTSYGGRLAVEVARQDPDGVSGVLLNSPLTPEPQSTESLVERAEDAIARLDTVCAAAPSCAALGSFADLVDEAAARLDAEPYRVPAEVVGDAEVVVDGALLRTGVFSAMYSAELLPVIPTALQSIAAGDVGIIDSFAGDLVQPPQADVDSEANGLFQVVGCADGDDISAASAPPSVADEWAELIRTWDNHCDVWDVPVHEGGRLPSPGGDVPVLAYAGAFDPVTPPAFAEEAVAGFPTSTVVVFPAGGHGARLDACTEVLTPAFTADPTAPIDTSCLDELPALFEASPP